MTQWYKILRTPTKQMLKAATEALEDVRYVLYVRYFCILYITPFIQFHWRGKGNFSFPNNKNLKQQLWMVVP